MTELIDRFLTRLIARVEQFDYCRFSLPGNYRKEHRLSNVF